MKRLASMIALAVLFTVGTSSARTWYVRPDGTGDVPTIQAGVDSVAEGDTLLLASGTYVGAGNYNILVPDKSFLITSETGDPDDCVIDCQGHLGSGRRGFDFETSWSTPPVVEGITVRNGYETMSGGAVYCEGSLIMRNCVFEANVSDYWGGAIAFTIASGEPVLKKCAFISNEAAVRGGAIVIDGVELYVTIDSCTFYGNQAEGGGAIDCFQHEAMAYIRNSVFIRNSAIGGGAIAVENMGADIDNCTFYANHGTTGSGIITSTWYVLPWAFADVRRCIIAYGTGGCGYYQPHWDPADPSLQCTNIYGNEGGDWVDSLAFRLGVDGNFSACPSFCNAIVEPYDLSLCDGSPCLPGNHPDGYGCGLVGALGEGCICGPTRTEPSTWGAIKAMYR